MKDRKKMLAYRDMQRNGIRFENCVRRSNLKQQSDGAIPVILPFEEGLLWVAHDNLRFDRDERFYRTVDERMHGMGPDEIQDYIWTARDAQ